MNIQDVVIDSKVTIKFAMQRMGKVGERTLFVVNAKGQLMGSLSYGDIRRWVLASGSLNADIQKAYHKKAFSVNEGYNIEEIKKIMIDSKMDAVPVINANRMVCDVLLWTNVFGQGTSIVCGEVDVPVVIMAGGKGTRLDPFTKILPKLLIPIGDKTIIEMILERFARHGVDEFYLTINHKSHMIKAYFEEINPPFKIHYVEEKKPLGTAGALKFLTRKIKDTFMVSNCDIIVNADYHEMVEFHKANDYDITIVGSFRHFTIPYGICHIQEGGLLTDIQEKPEYDFLVNTGMYVLDKRVLKLIPANTFFHITDLIKKVKIKGGRVGVFPLGEKSWIDVGQWEEYQKAIKQLTSII